MSNKDTLRLWVEAAVPGLTVIDGEQVSASAPRPPMPYAEILIVSSTPISGTPFESTSDEPDADDPNLTTLYRSHKRNGVARIDIFGNDAMTSTQIISELQLSIRRLVIRDILRAGGMVLRWLGSLTNIPTLRNTNWEDRSQADFQFRVVDSETEPYPWIETVNITPTYKNEGAP